MKTIGKYFLLLFTVVFTGNSVAQNQISSPTGQSQKFRSDTMLVKGYVRIDSGIVKLNNYRFMGFTKGTTGLNSWIGANSGNLTMTGRWNTFLGENAGLANAAGANNTFAGTFSGMVNTSATANTFVGYKSGYSNTSGLYNVFIGNTSGNSNVSGGSNVIVGYDAGFFNATGNNNVFLGRNAGLNNVAGNNNTSVGNTSGYNSTGSGNVFLGYRAGYNNGAANNRLYISNSDTSTPLVYGEFGTTSPAFVGKLVFNGRVSINSGTFPASADTNNTSGFKLFVNGGLLAKRLVVNTNWADYVFDESYKLNSLTQVEWFIKQNGHLPNVPSAGDVEKAGIDVGDIKRLQQEKIEELTLYAIEQNRALREQKDILFKQSKRIEEITRQAKLLKFN